MSDVVVVGAGISGVACARALTTGGHTVTVLERGRVPGGRMASRRHDGRPVDIGASYFTVSDPAFRQVVDDWHVRGLARPWTDTFTAVSNTGNQDRQGAMRWAAPAGLRGLVEDLSTGLDVRLEVTVNEVDRSDGGFLVDGRPADAVVLAMPDPQAHRLLSPSLAAAAAELTAEFEPVLALTSIWAQRAWPDVDGMFVNNSEVLGWIADDGLRRGDRAPVLVAHSTAAFARTWLDDPAAAAGPMTVALRAAVGLPAEVEPPVVNVHRWTFAKPTGTRSEPFLLTAAGLGVCGDGWSDKPRVEAAYLSGAALGAALCRQLR